MTHAHETALQPGQQLEGHETGIPSDGVQVTRPRAPHSTVGGPASPAALDAERAVLACVLYGKVLPSTLDLAGADFYQPDHEALWTVLEAMEQAGEVIDPLVASERLSASVKRLADPGLVPGLAGGSEVPDNAGSYAGMVRDASRRRHALAFVRQAEQRLAQGDDPAEVLDIGALEKFASAARSCPARRGQLVDPATVTSVRHEWIKKDWYPCDVVTVLAGHGGEGKSSFSLADVAAGSRGELRGRRWHQPVRSVIVATEDTQSDQKLRLRAADAVFEHIRFYTVANPKGEELHFDLTRDLPGLREAAAGFHADLLVIDPLSSVVPGDLNKTDVIRAAMDPLSALARDLHLAVVVVHHFNKGQGNASRKMTGSEAIRDTVRSAIFFAHDKETGEHVLSFDKANYSTLEGKNYSYELVSVPALDDDGRPMIDEEGNPETVPLVRILEETDNSVERIINTQPQGQDEDEAADCKSWLREWAEKVGGVLEAAEVRNACEAAGFSWSAAKRARGKLKMTSDRDGFGKGSKVYWKLPEAVTDPHRDHIEPIEPSSQIVSPMVPMASPMTEGGTAEPASSAKVTPIRKTPPPPPDRSDPKSWVLSIRPGICQKCHQSLTETDGIKGKCAARHRRAQEAAS